MESLERSCGVELGVESVESKVSRVGAWSPWRGQASRVGAWSQ